jgi:16S rRNA (uracil1498-N3)-methyltransferase
MKKHVRKSPEEAVSARFYCPDPPIGGRVRLEGDEAQHLSRVCRLGVGDVVEIFDGRGAAFESQVIAVERDWVDLATTGTPLSERRPPFPVVLATAVSKGDRFDWLIEKATELGVDRLIPLVTERSVVEPSESKLARLRRTIIEASKQCRRNRLMVLDSPMRWTELLENFAESLKYIADPAGIPAHRLAPIPASQAVILAVGPEGGFTPAEQSLAALAGWRQINLSVNILRIETAALAGCAVLLTRGQESNE